MGKEALHSVLSSLVVSTPSTVPHQLQIKMKVQPAFC